MIAKGCGESEDYKALETTKQGTYVLTETETASTEPT